MWSFRIFFALLKESTDKIRLCMNGRTVLHRAVYDLLFIGFAIIHTQKNTMSLWKDF